MRVFSSEQQGSYKNHLELKTEDQIEENSIAVFQHCFLILCLLSLVHAIGISSQLSSDTSGQIINEIFIMNAL